MATDPAAFVKSWTTEVSAQKTRNQMEDLLRRYGATGFTVSEDYASRTVAIAFMMPRSFGKTGGGTVEIRIPLSYNDVKGRLNQIPRFWNMDEERKNAQAERVAWRHVFFLTEAALMAAAIGVQSLEEAFFAHQMLSLPNGGQLRAIDATTMALKQLKSGQ